MSVHVTMTREDGTIETLDCRGWIELAAYLERHHGERVMPKGSERDA